MEERKFLTNFPMAVLFSLLVWLLTFLESGVTLNVIKNSTLWMHGYMIFASSLTFIFAFIYMKKIDDLIWLEESIAYGIVFILINIFLDYTIIFLILKTSTFNLQNFILYIIQFVLCITASFTVKKKYLTAL